MSDYERGPIQTYEVVWMSGHVERVLAHQVTLPMPDMGGIFSAISTTTDRVRMVTFHAEIDGHWMVTLTAREEDIRTIRNVTADERIPGTSDGA